MTRVSGDRNSHGHGLGVYPRWTLLPQGLGIGAAQHAIAEPRIAMPTSSGERSVAVPSKEKN